MKKNSLEKFIQRLEREKFTGKKTLELNMNQGKISRIYTLERKEEK